MGNSTSTIIFISIGVIVVATAVILLLRATPNPVINVPTTNPGTLTQPCSFDISHQAPNVLGSTGLCQNGFICEINQVCVADLGTICNSLSDCSSESITCSGRCSNQPFGDLNQLCPCNTGLDCTPQTTGYNVCKGGAGYPCSTNSDCVGLCTNGFCSGGLPIGSACVSQICAPPDLYCDPLNFCQEIGTISYQQNAYCNVLSPPGCSPGLACISNICSSTFGELGKNCSSAVCNLPLVCTTIPPIPNGGTTGNIQTCSFIPDNVCVTDCPGNYSCTSNKCLGSTGQACYQNAQCLSGNCANLQGLLMWTGTTWDNIATPVNDTFSKMMLGVHVDNQIPNIYFLGTQGVWKYSLGIWTLLQGINVWNLNAAVSDFTVTDVTEDIYYVLKKGVGIGAFITMVVDQNLVPITNFGTPDGQLIVNGNSITINTIAYTTFGDIYSDDINNNVYKNTTLLGNFGSKIRCYTATTETADDFMYITPNGVVSNGEFGVFTFPIFPVPAIGGIPYNNVSDYDVYINYTVDPISGLTVPDSSTSFFYAIASGSGTDYQIIMDTANTQSVLPGYVNAQSLIATNSQDLILYSPKVCN